MFFVKTFSPKLIKIFLFPLFLFSIFDLVWSREQIGPSELSSLIELHQPRKPPSDINFLDKFEIDFTLEKGGHPTILAIPGFKFYGCYKCHQAKPLAKQVFKMIRKASIFLKREIAPLENISLRKFIIQPYSNALLKENQFAHTTFDAIRIFPRTLIINTNFYHNATLIHEVLHLTQPFIGHPNELEAYALNALADPRFLLLNYRYFENLMQAFYVPDFQKILREFFARELKSEWKIPAETQWYILPANESALRVITEGIHVFRPVIEELFRLNREYPLLTSYWSDRTGIPSLVLDLAAVQVLPLPKIKVLPKIKDKAFQIFAQQFNKTDNTALGYVIDRKKETLMTLSYQYSLQNEGQGLAIYFHYLKKRFVGKDGELNLEPDDKKDFQIFLKTKVGEIKKMLEYNGLSREEKEAGRNLIEWIQKFAKTKKYLNENRSH